MRTTIRTRVAAVAVSIPLALVSLSACGSSDSKSTTAGDTTSSSTTPSDASSSAASDPSTSESSSAAPAKGQDVPVQQFLDMVKASYDNVTTAHMTMNIGASGMTIKAKGEIDYTGSAPKMAMTMSDPTGQGQGSMEMRLIGTTIYMKIPGASQGKFFKLDLNDPNNPLGDLSSLTDSMDPRHAMDQFAPAVQKVTFVGQESVDGTSADHYQVTMDPQKVPSLKKLGSSTQLPDTITYDMWVDSDHRMRQFTMNMAGTDMSVKYYDWDQPVDIQEPPASQVTTFPGS